MLGWNIELFQGIFFLRGRGKDTQFTGCFFSSENWSILTYFPHFLPYFGVGGLGIDTKVDDNFSAHMNPQMLRSEGKVSLYLDILIM